ncbi:hypothetical protein SCHPADRAFT_891575 [Schizopora paradoxa]|uniref:Uncharacterized protein n=1 Tax=Schizopora paradoxa TaxID=27342 RepID=A0A0H2RHQ0_9AGAM|nr:hypothetical protein SCHPADRAFT_891575 [Schizopora paradoxa]
MATPSSSATSPSPALSFAMPATVSDHSTEDPTERAERDEHRSKILKRTEFAKVSLHFLLFCTVLLRSLGGWARARGEAWVARGGDASHSSQLRGERRARRSATSFLVERAPAIDPSREGIDGHSRSRVDSAARWPCFVATNFGGRVTFGFPPHPPQRAMYSSSLARPASNVDVITRALRSTLALASYKAKHNVINVPLRNLEAQVAHIKPQTLHGISSADPLNASPSNDKKRKASTNASSSYYGAGLGPGSGPSSSSYNNIAGPSTPSTSSHLHTNAAHSLFASILAPPPSKRARTIHNPEAPPVPPAKPYAPQVQAASSSNHGKKKSKATAKPSKADKKSSKSRSNPSGGRKRAGSHDSTQTARSAFSGEDVNDTDIKAAATLTEIFLSRGAGSPRSSFTSAATSLNNSQSQSLPNSQSQNGGLISHSQRSSTSSLHVASPTLAHASSQGSQGRTHSRTQSAASIVSIGRGPASAVDDGRLEVNMEDATRRSATPTAARPGDGGKAHATDSEAANMMLLLANSPSPRRPTTVARDKDVARNVYAAGRVLFPTASQSSNTSGQSEEYGESSREGKVLARTLGSAGSFSSVFGSERTLVGESDVVKAGVRQERPGSSTPTSKVVTPVSTQFNSAPADPVVTPPTPPAPSLGDMEVDREKVLPSSLLPAPPFPSKATNGGSATPNQAFNLSDYINVSPSPAAYGATNSSNSVPFPPSSQPNAAARHKSSLSAPSIPGTGLRHQAVVSSPLRKSFDSSGVGMPMSSGFGGVARRLFDGEAPGMNGAEGAVAPGVTHPTPLESGIDLHS